MRRHKKSSAYNVVQLSDWQTENIEDLWVLLRPRQRQNKSIYINVVYAPGEVPAYSFGDYTATLSSKINGNPNDVFFVVGDFNIPSFSPLQSSPPSAKAMLLREFMEFTNMDQFNTIRVKKKVEIC